MKPWADESTAHYVVPQPAAVAGARWYLLAQLPRAEPQVVQVPSDLVLSIGRSPENALVVDDLSASRSHAQVLLQDNMLLLEDLHSRHGVTVNASIRPPGSKTTLHEGDVVHIGPLRLTVCLGAAAEPVPSDFPGAVVVAPATQQVFQMGAKVARFNTSVVIQGETGTGKEVLASTIHRLSPRAAGPFVRLNCGAFPEGLLEAELFGHEKGAFTGADKRRIGFLESASGGTLFLDEIGEMPMTTQTKLLVVLESKKVLRLGSSTPVDIDVRYISATHKDLAREVQAGRFREDLLYRLNSFVLRVPALRERPEDLRPLTQLLLANIAVAARSHPPQIALAAFELLRRYSWPGNVRELKNALEHACVLAEGFIEPEHLPASVRAGIATPVSSAAPAVPGSSVNLRADLHAVERENVAAALEACGGNQTKAAQRLGISRRALIHKMDKFGLR
jgi:two-component system, NtrC family, response regulator AtoC